MANLKRLRHKAPFYPEGSTEEWAVHVSTIGELIEDAVVDKDVPKVEEYVEQLRTALRMWARVRENELDPGRSRKSRSPIPRSIE